MLQVVVGGPTKYENIVCKNHEEFIQIFPENIIHHGLEGAGALVSPNGINRSPKDRYIVLVQVFGLSASFIRIWQYPLRRSKDVKYCSP
jgi:hypothetical protein